MQGQIFFRKDAGFSVLEIVVSMGLLGLMVAIGLQSLTRTQEMRILVEDRDVITQLEEQIRRAVHSNVALAVSASRSPALQNCLAANNQACPQGQNSFDLWMNSELPVSGTYNGDGSTCEGGNCLIRVQTNFQGVCGNTPNCDRARYLLIRYQISADYHLLRSNRGNQGILRSGVLRRSFERVTDSDDNLACELDQFNRSQFASQVRPNSINCVSSPPLNRQIQGVQPGDCRPDREILAGFDAAGAPICQPIKFSVRSQP